MSLISPKDVLELVDEVFRDEREIVKKYILTKALYGLGKLAVKQQIEYLQTLTKKRIVVVGKIERLFQGKGIISNYSLRFFKNEVLPYINRKVEYENKLVNGNKWVAVLDVV